METSGLIFLGKYDLDARTNIQYFNTFSSVLLGISSAFGAGEAIYESETFHLIRDDITNDIHMFAKDGE
jgi:siderophore synthetase component